MQTSLANSATMTCSRCFAFSPEAADVGRCGRPERPQSLIAEWPKTTAVNPACETFYPLSAVKTCKPGREPMDYQRIRQDFLMRLTFRTEPLDKSQYYNVTKVAYKLGVTESAVRGYIKSGQLPAHKRKEGWMVKVADFEAFKATWKPGRPGRPARDC
ncbi:MAG: helix-turn-helix domain-containing protein [Deltaproteobacteria bacterium]|nr:helix-turn-helix domain-containing protein [Deltaproteobacteria bacterium]